MHVAEEAQGAEEVHGTTKIRRKQKVVLIKKMWAGKPRQRPKQDIMLTSCTPRTAAVGALHCLPSQCHLVAGNLSLIS